MNKRVKQTKMIKPCWPIGYMVYVFIIKLYLNIYNKKKIMFYSTYLQ